MKVRELLTDESKWCKVHLAQKSNGYRVEPESDDACRWCLYGAILKCYGSVGQEQPRVLVESKIDMAVGPWNDAPERSFAEVKALVEELDI